MNTPSCQMKMEKETTQFSHQRSALRNCQSWFSHIWLYLLMSSCWLTSLPPRGPSTAPGHSRLLLEQREMVFSRRLSPPTWNLPSSLPIPSGSELSKGNKELALILCNVPSGPVPQYIPSPIYQLESSYLSNGHWEVTLMEFVPGAFSRRLGQILLGV